MALPSPTVDFPDLSAMVQANRSRADGLMGSAWAQLSQNNAQRQATAAAAQQQGLAQQMAGWGTEQIPAQGGATAQIPSGERADYIRQGLLKRGMPQHIADAFVMNFQDESGLDPAINEQNPLVPGSRGGFGLYQLTGPRRKAYEGWASQSGHEIGAIDPQLDFLMQELNGSESAAAQKIFSARNTGQAAAAIVEHFLRPAPEHLQRRRQRYLGLTGSPAQPQVPQTSDPHFAAMARWGQPRA